MTKAMNVSMDQIMSELDAYMHELIRRELDGKLVHMVEYHLGWRNAQFEMVRNGNMGKRGRPMLTVLISQLFGKEYTKVFPAATAIEYIHNFSLVFDDIQDKDEIRRGRESVWCLWGEDEAINVGCALQTLASFALSEMLPHVSQKTVYDAQRYINRIMLRLCHGQQLDISMTKAKELIHLEEYIDMVSGKTAALFEAAAYIGALCAGATKRDQQLCQEFGHYIGMCFQLYDDMVGVWGSKERGLDKPSLDLEKRKKTYPVIHAYSFLDERSRQELLHIYYANDTLRSGDMEKIREMLDLTGALHETKRRGDLYLDLALTRLRKVRGNEAAMFKIEHWIKYVTDKQLQSVDVSTAGDGLSLPMS